MTSVPTDADEIPAEHTIKAIPVRHYGRWVSAVVVLLLLAALVAAFAGADIQWSITGDNLFTSASISGAWHTLLISVCAMALGLLLGVVAAVMRLSQNPVTSSVAWGYIWLFRGTPVLVQLLIWWNLALVFPTLFGVSTNTLVTPFVAALLGLGINEGAYMAEIVRAGIQSVDEGQAEAAHALGLSRAKTMRRVILPQAMRVIVPPTGNEFINMLKTSSLAYVVTYGELMTKAKDVYTNNLAVMELLFVTCFWYLVLTTVFSIGQYYLERYYAKGATRTLPPTPLQKIKTNLLSLGRAR
ncbi:polar amino acid transport system permease protein [Kitasatospora sp. SolWspMP-SS2h]|uniref:amino acid ABC transporter permease n=1 Tax=Kitasatospora sp. SolWspMP-SS2h TaxID=1305729 RepID=UPI000DB920D8|nr:amino acid ABC transporter permease [Kitasatospora sp. SolWspMP-SS2h]RAJ41374.1 polar amino acid transport system permease protein [Kitasatospora sp. SolWspMP-SS2h]